MKFQKKIKHNEKMSRTRLRFPHPRSRSEVKVVLSNSSKTTEANLTKLHGKIGRNETVCRAQELGSYAHGQGHIQVKSVSQQ